MPDSASNGVAIDVIADVVCPWCYIGKRRLEQVIASFHGIDVQVRWRPYQLEPNLPRDDFHFRPAPAEFSVSEGLGSLRDEILAAGRQVGVAFAFDKISRNPNTLDAHRLVRLAKIGGIQGKVVERVFKAFFCDGIDIGNRRNLVGLGIEAGLDRESVEGLFAARNDILSVQEELATTRRLGVTTLPFFIFGDDVVVPGAQSREMLAAALSKASTTRTAQTQVRPPRNEGRHDA
jgi:predicted DsbA family dithiol-disulfide isomerase